MVQEKKMDLTYEYNINLIVIKNSLKSLTQNPLDCLPPCLWDNLPQHLLVVFALLCWMIFCLNCVSARFLSFKNTRTKERPLPGDISKGNRGSFFNIKLRLNCQFAKNMTRVRYLGFYRAQPTLSALIYDILVGQLTQSLPTLSLWATNHVMEHNRTKPNSTLTNSVPSTFSTFLKSNICLSHKPEVTLSTNTSSVTKRSSGLSNPSPTLQPHWLNLALLLE